jgi:hypothetical protein
MSSALFVAVQEMNRLSMRCARLSRTLFTKAITLRGRTYLFERAP